MGARSRATLDCGSLCSSPSTHLALALRPRSHLIASHRHLPHRIAIAAATAPSLVEAHDSVVEWVQDKIEGVVHDIRVPSAREKIDALAASFVSGAISYEPLVELLGGRQPSEAGSVHTEGAWGVTTESGANGTSSYITDVVEAAGHADSILGPLWGELAGCTGATRDGVGLKALARQAVAKLSAANTKKVFEDFFQRFSLASHRMRTRRDVDHDGNWVVTLVDFDELRKRSVTLVLDPAINQQNSEAAVDQRFADLVASAGQKRGSAALTLAPSPSGGPSQAPAPSPAPGRNRKKDDRAPSPAPASATGATAPSPSPAATAPGPAASAPQPAPSPAPSSAPGPAWKPTYAPGSITSLIKKVQGSKSAVEHFNYECGLLNLPIYPCAMHELSGKCRGAQGGCRACEGQAKRSPPIPAPPGLVAKIKLACDASTAAMLI